MKIGRVKSLSLGFFLSFASLFIFMGIAEFGFRLFPPTGIYHSGLVFDPHIGYRFKPNSEIIYNKRNGLVNHNTNRYGWVDRDHHDQKGNSVFRVGFFGDSYVEGLSVPAEQHFFRNLPTHLSERPMEYFGFGRSGFGTVQSYLNSKMWTEHYDLDLIVYVFVENDIGDSISWIKKKRDIPYAKKTNSDPGFIIERKYQDSVIPASSFLQDIQYFIGTKSRLVQVIKSRVALLKEIGVLLSSQERVTPLKESPKRKIPNSNEVAVKWPENIRVHAQEVAYSVLKTWSKEIHTAKKQFVILYVPKGSKYLPQDHQLRDTFKGWLVNSCEKLNIPLLDPSTPLLLEHQRGIEVFRDHFTPVGHQVVREFLKKWLTARLTTNEER